MAWHECIVGVFAVALLVSGGRNAATQETPPEALASQLRLQDHRCDEPVTAQRDAQLSKSDHDIP
jgi:hypothetical protein